MYFSMEKLLNYQGNRYELAYVCIEYSKKLRYLSPAEYEAVGEKEALVAIDHLLEKKVHYTTDQEEIDIYKDEIEFLRKSTQAEVLASEATAASASTEGQAEVLASEATAAITKETAVAAITKEENLQSVSSSTAQQDKTIADESSHQENSENTRPSKS